MILLLYFIVSLLLYFIISLLLNFVLIKIISKIDRKQFVEDYEGNVEIGFLILLSILGIFTVPINLYIILRSIFKRFINKPTVAKMLNNIADFLNKKIIQ